MAGQHILQRFRNTAYSIVLGIVGFLLISASFMVPSAKALTLDLAARDCDSNAVIKCGAATTSELLQKYNNQADVRAIFRHFGISPSEMSRIGSTAVAGIVDRDGNVTVNGRVVATGAMTAGRQNMSGSNSVSAGGTQFYMRAPNVSFQTQRLKAFVVMSHANHGGASDTKKRGQDTSKRFSFAIIASCGNPVKAVPKKLHKPAPAPPAPVQPKKPKPAPKPQSQQQSQNQSQQQSTTASATANVTVEQAPPPPQPQPETKTVVERVEVPVPVAVQQPAQAAPAPVQELPKTGIENMGGTLGIAGLATLGTTALHFLYVRRKNFV